jgi:hypothetical protein
MDIVSGNAQQIDAGRQKITVQVGVNGEVVKQASMSANYGIAQVTWSPSE